MKKSYALRKRTYYDLAVVNIWFIKSLSRFNEYANRMEYMLTHNGLAVMEQGRQRLLGSLPKYRGLARAYEARKQGTLGSKQY